MMVTVHEHDKYCDLEQSDLEHIDGTLCEPWCVNFFRFSYFCGLQIISGLNFLAEAWSSLTISGPGPACAEAFSFPAVPFASLMMNTGKHLDWSSASRTYVDIGHSRPIPATRGT